MVFVRSHNRKPFQNKRDPQKTKVDKSKITCYGFNKIGRFKTECPRLKRPTKISPFKKKSMMASWDDSNNSNLETKKEEVNLCLMTNSDTEEVDVSNSS